MTTAEKLADFCDYQIPADIETLAEAVEEKAQWADADEGRMDAVEEWVDSMRDAAQEIQSAMERLEGLMADRP
jgi:hypothetical protein